MKKKGIVAEGAVSVGPYSQPYPARSTIGVNELPLNAMVEIEVIAKR